MLLKVWRLCGNICFRVCRLQIFNNPHLKKIHLHIAAPPQQIWPPLTHHQTRIITVIIIIIQCVLLIQAEGRIYPMMPSSSLSPSNSGLHHVGPVWEEAHLSLISVWALRCVQGPQLCDCCICGGGVVLLVADLIVATIQVSRDYVSAAALRADNLSLLQLIWQHVNESCLKLKANINSHLAKGSECPQSQCIKWFDW